MHNENDNFEILKLNMAMKSKSQIESFELPFSLKKHDFANLILESWALRDNPLGDPTRRHNYVLVPKGNKKKYPVIFHLSGYFSTGFNQFQVKALDQNFIQKLDAGVARGIYPHAVHVFVEATTYWGGSQFINSAGCGNYSDYIRKDLIQAVQDQLPVSATSNHSCVMGGSSGGYGALSLISENNSPFGIAFAAAPDSYFEASLLPELFHAAPELLKFKSFKDLQKMLDAGELQDKKSFFNLANVVAMAHCYSPTKAFKKGFLEFPIDLHTGEIKTSLWQDWLKHDPVRFLKSRKKNLDGKVIHLDVGKYDNFSLQFGTRQIAKVLKDAKVKHSYTEFPGNHFGLSARRLGFLEKLTKPWRAYV